MCLAYFKDEQWIATGCADDFRQSHWKIHFWGDWRDLDEDDPELYTSQTFLEIIDSNEKIIEGQIPQEYWIKDTVHTGYASEPYIVESINRKPNSYYKKCLN